MNDSVKQTLLAKVYDVAQLTPLDYAAKISNEICCKVYLKREDLQPVHSFKLRGAYNKISQLSDEEKDKGVITASAGNHAQGVALASKKLGISALIIMPKTTPPIKINAVKSFGAIVELYGDNYSEAAERCTKRAKETGRTFVHPFDDPLVITGQGTIGREIIEQLPEVTHIFVPVGGGGLVAGVAQYVKSIRPDVKIISVEPEDSNAMKLSLESGKRVVLNHVGIFADGVAVRQIGKNTFNIAKKYVDDAITVTNDQICAAIKSIFEQTRGIVEPAGALSLAGILEYQKNHDLSGGCLVSINSGANMTFERLQFIAERTLIGSGKEAIFAIYLPENPGALQHFCSEVLNGHSITQFGYRLRSREKACMMLGISLASEDDKQKFMQKMSKNGYKYSDLSYEDLSKEHVRHMIGGPAPQAKNEHFYHISFPERPGALTEFLKTLSNNWNISLFHYRGLGGDIGSVLIGFEAEDRTALESAITATSYQWELSDKSIGMQTFII